MLIKQGELPAEFNAKIENKRRKIDPEQNTNKRANGAINHSHIAVAYDQTDQILS